MATQPTPTICLLLPFMLKKEKEKKKLKRMDMSKIRATLFPNFKGSE